MEFEHSIAHLASNLIIENYDLSHIHYTALFQLFNRIIHAFSENSNFIISAEYLPYLELIIDQKNYLIVVSLLITSFYYLFLNYERIIDYFNNDKITKMKTYNSDHITVILQYLEYFPERFSSITKKCAGNPETKILEVMRNSNIDISYQSYKTFPEWGHSIKIMDSTYDISGTITFKKYTRSISTKLDDNNIFETDIFVPYCCFEVTSNNQSNQISDYLDYMQKQNKIEKEEKEEIILYHWPVFSDRDSHDNLNRAYTEIYEGPKLSLEDREEQFINSFFHPKKNELWNFIKKIHFEPQFFKSKGQEPRFGVLAHGPPGTGKSSFGYRIARALNRHIISIDLKVIKKKSQLWELLREVNIYDDYYNAKDIVFIFDEFDYGIKHLYNKQQKKIKDLMYLEKINKLENLIKIEKESTGKKKKKGPMSSMDDDSEDSDEESSKNIDSDDLVLSDLLDVFQGAVPIPGLICIATTNDIDTIEKLCPPLIRPGRLTPIYFGHPDADIINQISQYYFKREFTDPPATLNKSTSEIVDMALKCLILGEEGFNNFKERIHNMV